ncbi:MAG: phosphatase PAP2 family protein [Rhizobiaceae bacterium]|nr:phosphatase PAP2 family protein [Rhizobiaceae bacterium]MCV0405767.1 phosphatase PAP2 family protein [Rhizobiaceae bacterium]
MVTTGTVIRIPSRRALSRLDPATIVAVTVAALGLWGFAELLDEVSEGESGGFDEWLLLALRQPGDTSQPIGPWWLEIAMNDLTALGSFAVIALMTGGVAGFLVVRDRFGAAVLLVVSVASGAILSSLLKVGIDRPRPDIVAQLADVHTLSFPSGHAMVSAVAYLTIGAVLASFVEDRRTQLYIVSAAVTGVVIIGSTRVYLGVHWPTDVLAGWCIGAAWAMACWLVARLLQGRVLRPPIGAETGPDESA